MIIKLIHNHIKDVMYHVGQKKHEIKKLLEESENRGSGFIKPGELPKEPKASPEIQARFDSIMKLLHETDAWFEQILDQLYGMPEKRKELLDVVRIDAINFIKRIDQI